MIFCEGICIVTVRKDTRVICWMGLKMSVSPGPTDALKSSQKKDNSSLILLKDAERGQDV